ncbi:MAG: hypothetical protein K0R46_3175, partial [Herbinix sp.]|nr:hypothetical protein [Herbinix sp.]
VIKWCAKYAFDNGNLLCIMKIVSNFLFLMNVGVMFYETGTATF